MRIYTLSELQLLSRTQLLELHEIISRHLMVLSDNTNERHEALENLDRIRRVLNRQAYRPCPGGVLHPAP